MSLSGHLELFGAEAQSPRPTTGEMIPDTSNLSSSAAELADACGSSNVPQKHPQVRSLSGAVVPRIAAVAEDYLAVAAYKFDVTSFTEYINAFQDTTVLNMAELWALIPVLKLVLLEKVAERGKRLLENSSEPQGLHRPVRSLKAIRETTWKGVIEPLIRG